MRFYKGAHPAKQAMSDEAIELMIKAYATAGIAGFTPHGLRASFVTLALEGAAQSGAIRCRPRRPPYHGTPAEAQNKSRQPRGRLCKALAAFDEQRPHFCYQDYANEPRKLRQYRIFLAKFAWIRKEIVRTTCACRENPANSYHVPSRLSGERPRYGHGTRRRR